MTAPAFPLFTVQKRHGSEERIKLSGGQITAMAEEIWADNLFITHLKRIVVVVFFFVLQIHSMQITAKKDKK